LNKNAVFQNVGKHPEAKSKYPEAILCVSEEMNIQMQSAVD